MKNKNWKIIVIMVLIILFIFLITKTTISIFMDNQTKERVVESKMEEVYGTSHIDIHDTTHSKIKNGEKYSTASPIKKEHFLDNDYKISDMQIYTKDGWCYIDFMLTNIGDEKCNKDNCSLHLSFYKDKEMKQEFNFAMIEIPALKENESKRIVSQQIQDFTIKHQF